MGNLSIVTRAKVCRERKGGPHTLSLQLAKRRVDSVVEGWLCGIATAGTVEEGGLEREKHRERGRGRRVG